MPHFEVTAHRARRGLKPIMGALLLIGVLSGCSVRGDGGKVAHDKTVPVAVTPNAVNKLPENINEVSITIANGAFGVNQVVLQRQGGSVIHLMNQDGTAYQFQIVPDLVNPTAIAANTTTEVGFTASGAGDFTGQLLPEKGGAALASIDVRIQSAGGVNP